MNEKTVIKRSYQIFALGCIVFIILGIFLKDISYLLGFILGYLLNLVVFALIIKMCDEILSSSTSTIFVIMTFILKLIVYSIGFIIAVKSKWFHILGVFFGYMMTKISIYTEGYINKGGEVNEN
jgi:ATP synthase I chain.